MAGILPKSLSFADNGGPILAVLVENPPGVGSWTLLETCAICSQPLEHRPFYATDPLLFYVHADCLYDYAVSIAAAAAADANTTSFAGLSNFGTTQSRSISQTFNSSSYQSTACAPAYTSTPCYDPSINYPPLNAYPPPSPLCYYNQYQPPYNYSSYYYSHATYHHPYTSETYYENVPSYSQYYPPPSLRPPPPPHSPPPSSSSSSSSVPGWARLATTTMLGSFLQALFSFLITGS